MAKRTVFSRFRRDEKGATAIEFAVVAGVFFMMMMAIIEYGLYMMTSIAIESAVTQAGRSTMIGSGGSDRVTFVRNQIMRKTSGLPRASVITISAAPLADGGTRAPDLCMSNGSSGEPTTGACPTGTPYIEVNGVNGYQGNGATALGTAGQLVEVRANYPWRVMFPVLNQFFSSTDGQGNRVNGVVLITSTTVVKNEPF